MAPFLSTIEELAPRLGLKQRSLAVYLTLGKDGPHAVGRVKRAPGERGPGIGLYDRAAVIEHVQQLRKAGFRKARGAAQ